MLFNALVPDPQTLLVVEPRYRLQSFPRVTEPALYHDTIAASDPVRWSARSMRRAADYPRDLCVLSAAVDVSRIQHDGLVVVQTRATPAVAHNSITKATRLETVFVPELT